MSQPVVVVPKDATLDAIASLLEQRRISAVPVVTDGAVVGIVSSTDLLRARTRGESGTLPAAALMSTELLAASPDEPLEDAARRLAAGRVHRLVVLDEARRALGILGPREMLTGLAEPRVTAPVSAVMSSPVVAIDIGDSIAVATERLAETNVHGLVVVEGSWPVGVFTHREALAARGLPPSLRERPVEDVMSYETICLDVTTPIFRAIGYAVAMNVRRFLIVEHRALTGIVSVVDLVGVAARARAG